MAIFYEHIKGCGAGSTNQPNSANDLWTWIDWQKRIEQNFTSREAKWLPHIRINNSNDKTTAKDFGYIVTNDAIDQIFEQEVGFRNNIWVGENIAATGKISTKNTISTEAKLFLFNSQDLDQSYNIGFVNNENGEHSCQFNYNIQKSSESSESINTFPCFNIKYNNGMAEISTPGKSEALYFNATSDRRAKTNILPSQFKGLDIVNALSVYNFDYKSTGTPSIGIMAQDAAIQDLGSFNLVDNLNASGEDNDFMSIKESKLVYVLWKAVQELSAEVKRLESIVNTTCTRKMK